MNDETLTAAGWRQAAESAERERDALRIQLAALTEERDHARKSADNWVLHLAERTAERDALRTQLATWSKAEVATANRLAKAREALARIAGGFDGGTLHMQTELGWAMGVAKATLVATAPEDQPETENPMGEQCKVCLRLFDEKAGYGAVEKSSEDGVCIGCLRHWQAAKNDLLFRARLLCALEKIHASQPTGGQLERMMK